MIIVKPLVKAKILIIGSGDLVASIVSDFTSYGIGDTIVVDATDTTGKTSFKVIQRDPEEFIRTDQDYFKSFDLVISVNQPRAFELALSDLRWPKDGTERDPDLPMIVARSAGNNCKMRCQYRELPVNRGKLSKFISLSMDLPAWTEEKCALVASTVKEEFKPEQNPNFQAYLATARATIQFQKSNGVWPTVQDKEQVQRLMHSEDIRLQPQVPNFIQTFCEKGLASVAETTTLMSRIIALDGTKLITGNGQPINTTTLQDVVEVVLKE